MQEVLERSRGEIWMTRNVDIETKCMPETAERLGGSLDTETK
jgi:hypothetical protein